MKSLFALTFLALLTGCVSNPSVGETDANASSPPPAIELPSVYALDNPNLSLLIRHNVIAVAPPANANPFAVVFGANAFGPMPKLWFVIHTDKSGVLVDQAKLLIDMICSERRVECPVRQIAAGGQPIAGAINLTEPTRSQASKANVPASTNATQRTNRKRQLTSPTLQE